MPDIIKEAQKDRVKLYTKRYALGQDIFTGKSLNKKDLEQWEVAEERKAKTLERGFGFGNRAPKHLNNRVPH
tara:strand:- start:80 stop:295 length:216 start_codon:yes stop_codon:yes gene_type:complete